MGSMYFPDEGPSNKTKLKSFIEGIYDWSIKHTLMSMFLIIYVLEFIIIVVLIVVLILR